MARFKDYDDYYRFSFYIKHQSRHFLDTDQRRFINAVLRTSERRVRTLAAGTILWRAAIGCIEHNGNFSTYEDEAYSGIEAEPFPVERMKPMKGRAYEGRINPKGIPCLYTATNADTAIAETRPWVGTKLTVARIILIKEVKLVDCCLTTEDLTEDPEQPWKDRENWAAINMAFSQPVGRSDEIADYAPTQFLAEAFASAAHEGILYTSRLGTGQNVALFDPDVGEVASRRIYYVHTLTADYTLTGSTIYVDKFKHDIGELDPEDPITAAVDEDDVPF